MPLLQICPDLNVEHPRIHQGNEECGVVLTVPPIAVKANQALIGLLTKELRSAKPQIWSKSRQISRRKLIDVGGDLP